MEFRKFLSGWREYLFNKTYEFDESWSQKRDYPFFGEIDKYHRQEFLFGFATTIYGMAMALVGSLKGNVTTSELNLGMVPIVIGCSDVYLRILKEHSMKINHPSGIFGSFSSLVETVKNSVTANKKVKSNPEFKGKLRFDLLYGFDIDKDGEIDEIREIFGPTYNRGHERFKELRQYFE